MLVLLAGLGCEKKGEGGTQSASQTAEPGAAHRGDSGGGGKMAADVPREADAAPSLPDSLVREDIAAGMAKVEGRVGECFAADKPRPKNPGTVEVLASINGEGQVTDAQVFGRLAGFPVAACVERAVRDAQFRKWAGTSVRVKYSFQIP